MPVSYTKSRRYRGRPVKHDEIEIYEYVGPDYDTLLDELQSLGLSRPDITERLQAEEERYARYTPVLRFILLDPKRGYSALSG